MGSLDDKILNLGVWRGGTTAMAIGADRHGDIVTQHNPTTGDRTTSRAYDPFGTPTATLNATGGNETSSWASPSRS